MTAEATKREEGQKGGKGLRDAAKKAPGEG